MELGFFLVAYREAAWNFSSPGPRFLKEFRGFPDMELGIFRVAKSSGGGRLGPKATINRADGIRPVPSNTG